MITMKFFKKRKEKAAAESQLKKVEYILRHYPETRNNDSMLCRLYWELFEGARKLEDLDHVTSPENIQRARRKLNQRKMYLPTDPEVEMRRKVRRNQYKQIMLEI
jgi:hypothetical protein